MKNFVAGHHVQRDQYKSFEPKLLNRAWSLDDMEIQQLLGQANRALGRLDMYSEHIPNIDLYIKMHVMKEATQSSKIEGTQTSIEEILLEKEDIDIEKRDDWTEVQNYIAGMNQATQKLERQELPFSTRLIRETHATLMQSVRGKNKMPGDFRQSQNWIGGASLKDAAFIPPAHQNVPELMSDLEKFVHNEEDYFPELLKIALVHYQFETIHPFLDGNGRVGRLMITLYLVSKGLLKQPILYLSDFFERNRRHYYDNLTRVRTHNDLKQWFKFFLVGVIETAQNSTDTFTNILKLQKETDLQLQGLGSRTASGQKVLEALYQHPIIDVAGVTTVTGLSSSTAYRLIAELEKLDILQETTGSQRGKLYRFSHYLALFQ